MVAICLCWPAGNKLQWPEVRGPGATAACSVAESVSVGWSQWVGRRHFHGFITAWSGIIFWFCLLSHLPCFLVCCRTPCIALIKYVWRNCFWASKHVATELFHSAIFFNFQRRYIIQSITPESTQGLLIGEEEKQQVYCTSKHQLFVVIYFFSPQFLSGSPVAKHKTARRCRASSQGDQRAPPGQPRTRL